MRTRLLVLAALALAALSASLLVPVIHAQFAPTAARTTDIRATIISVEKLDFPRARLKLRVIESSGTEVFSLSGRMRDISVQNYLRTRSGKVDFQDKENIGAIGAYYLLQGDEIRGKLFSGSSTPGRAGEWFVYGIERLKSGSTDSPMTSTNVQGNLRLTLQAAVRSSSEPVQMSLTVENSGTQPEVLRFSSGQEYDFVVSSDGREVWRWSSGRMFIQALTSLSLSPGEKKVFTATWSQTDNKGRPVGPGVYAIEAVVTSASSSKPKVGPVTVTRRS